MANEDVRHEIKKQIESKKKDIQSDSPQVEIARMNIEAVGKLADDKNDVFSQLTKDKLQDETFDYALAINFARHPLKGLEDRLRKRGIKEPIVISSELGEIDDEREIKITVPILEEFLKEFLIRRHCLNRGRVQEYIDALDKANGKDRIFQQEQQQNRGILSRLG